MGPLGKSAMMVAASLPAPSLPAAVPPNLRKSSSLRTESLPAPTTIRRSAFRPSGARMSSVEQLFPLNWLVAAARLTRPVARPSTLRVAAPNFSVSSQKTTRMPRRAVEKGTKPTVTASGMAKPPIRGLSLVGNSRTVPGKPSRRHSRPQELSLSTMACREARCQASRRGAPAT
jgi:hypothetical protein